LKPLAPDRWPEELAEIKNFLISPLNIHSMMAHHPDLMKAWSPFRNHVVANSKLSPRHRELLILRTAWNCNADYEWRHHVERGLQAGLDENDIGRVKQGAEAPGWKADESVLLLAADDCYRINRISDETLVKLDLCFDTRQQLDITVTIGMYITLAMIIKTWDVPME